MPAQAQRAVVNERERDEEREMNVRNDMYV